MGDKRLAEIEAREEAATKGPWTLDIAPNGAFAIEWEDGPWDQSIINARFMVQAREDIPFLLAEVRRLERERNEALNTLRDVTSLWLGPGSKEWRDKMRAKVERVLKEAGK